MANVSEAPLRIFLVGMMGSGKTTVGSKLATELNIPFVDLDDEIEKRTNLSIAKIFQQHGEFNFRACEAQVLRDLPRRFPSAVIATGGGAPFSFDNMAFINNNGLSIFLDIDMHHLIDRLAANRSSRPLLNRDDWETFLAGLNVQRRPIYKQAQVSIKVVDGDSHKAVQAILEAMPQITGH